METLWSNYAQDVTMSLTFTDANGVTSPFPIPSGTTVEAILRDSQAQPITPKKTVLEAAPGSDWPNGVMVVQFTAADLSTIDSAGQGDIEASVDGKPVGTERLSFVKGVVPNA